MFIYLFNFFSALSSGHREQFSLWPPARYLSVLYYHDKVAKTEPLCPNSVGAGLGRPIHLKMAMGLLIFFRSQLNVEKA